MLDNEAIKSLRKLIIKRTNEDKRLLTEICSEIRLLAGEVRTIKPRSTTAVSLVASDGGNNRLMFDPFLIQFVRVVDSYGKELCIDAVSPATDTDLLSKAQFNEDGSPRTALGLMMKELDINPPALSNLSHMIPEGEKTRGDPNSVSPSWVMVYRDLCEWAVLYERICKNTFATDTLLVRDGLLRSKIFRGENFIKWRKKVEEAIEKIYREDKRKVFLVGIAKHSKVLTRYNLAIAIEDIMPAGDPCYVRIPREIEAKAYVWPEYARGSESEAEGKEAPKFVAGDMFFVRFGSRSGDPVWTVDILSSQSKNAAEIFGYLLSDAIVGFPIPFYPRCLQLAHEYAQVTGFDLEVMQDEVYEAVRGLLLDRKKNLLDEFHLNPDFTRGRYG